MVSPRRSQLVSPSKQRAMSSTTRPHLPRPGGPRRHESRAPRAAEPLSTPSGSVPTPQAGDRLAPLIQDPGHLCSDEPTTGLRPADPGRVIDILDRLVDVGAQSWSSSTASTSSIERLSHRRLPRRQSPRAFASVGSSSFRREMSLPYRTRAEISGSSAVSVGRAGDGRGSGCMPRGAIDGGAAWWSWVEVGFRAG